MSRLEDKLHDAAQGPVGFDHHDVAHRVRRLRRNRAVVIGAVAVCAVVGVAAGLVADLGDDDERVETAEQPGGPITVDELVADRWIVFAYSEVTVGVSPPPFIQFDEDGHLGGVDGCQTFSGSWELDGSRLNTSLQLVEASSDCYPASAGVAELLVDDPLVDRFDEGSDDLRLISGDDFFGFRRFDRIGEAPTVELLQGDWSSNPVYGEDGVELFAMVSFDADGSGTVEIAGCSQEFDWTLDGDRVDIDGLSDNGLPCGDGSVVGGGLLVALTSNPRVRVDGSMWVSSDVGIDVFTRVGDPDATPTTTSMPDAESELSMDYVVSSPDGITLHESGGGMTGVAEGETAFAFAVGPDLIVHQPASTSAPGYPPSPDGVPVVWKSGEERSLPVDPQAVRVRLLDARLLDGRPVALVAEIFGGVGPDDTFEELVLFDLETLERTTIVRREAWESGHFDARLLPDGDVVGLISAEAQTLLTRWSQGSDTATWTVELGIEIAPTLTMHDGEIRLVDAGFTSDFEPTLTIYGYSLDGTLLDETGLTVEDSGHELGAGLFCTDWYDDARLLCGRGDGPPIAVNVAAGSFDQLDGLIGGFATMVRPG